MRIAASTLLSLVSKYILVRDATFFVVDFFTGDRASDLGQPGFQIKGTGRVLNKVVSRKRFAEGLPVSLSLSLFESQMFVLFFGWIIMFVPAKRWGSPCLRDIFSERPTVKSGSGKGHFLVRQFIIVCACISPRRSFVMGKRPIVLGSGFPTPLAFWVVLRKK